MGKRLSEKSIGQLIDNPTVFNQGKSIVQASGLMSINRKGHIVSGVVHSGRLKHQVDLEFTEGLTFDYWQCTCGKSSETGFCRHAAALLIGLEFEEGKDQEIGYDNVLEYGKTSLLGQGRINSVYAFDRFTKFGITSTGHKIPFRIEIACTCTHRSMLRENAFSWTITMKAGEGRLYIVKKIGEFAQAVTEGQCLVFGKNLTYDPALHYIGEDHMALLGFLYMVVRLEQRRDPYGYGYNNRSLGTGNTKELTLDDNTVVKSFLDNLKNVPFNLSYVGRTSLDGLDIKAIIEEDLLLPLTIEIDEARERMGPMRVSMANKEE